jgi:hypothetical protein
LVAGCGRVAAPGSWPARRWFLLSSDTQVLISPPAASVQLRRDLDPVTGCEHSARLPSFGRQVIPSHHLSTLSARRVFQRLGVPTPPSRSKWTRPGWMRSSSHWPSGCRLDCTTATASAIRRSGSVLAAGSSPAHAARRSASSAETRTPDTLPGRRPPCSCGGTGRVRAGTPAARSNSSRPSSTLIVVSKEDRTDPFSASQFQPPSASRSIWIRSAIAATSTPKYAPSGSSGR